MVPSQQEEVLRVLDFEGEQEKHSFNLHGASALVVPEEQVVGIWGPALLIEYLPQIVELAMDVAYDFYWRLQFKENGLVRKNVHTG